MSICYHVKGPLAAPIPEECVNQLNKGPNLLKDTEAWYQRMIDYYSYENHVFGLEVFWQSYKITHS